METVDPLTDLLPEVSLMQPCWTLGCTPYGLTWPQTTRPIEPPTARGGSPCDAVMKEKMKGCIIPDVKLCSLCGYSDVFAACLFCVCRSLILRVLYSLCFGIFILDLYLWWTVFRLLCDSWLFSSFQNPLSSRRCYFLFYFGSLLLCVSAARLGACSCLSAVFILGALKLLNSDLCVRMFTAFFLESPARTDLSTSQVSYEPTWALRSPGSGFHFLMLRPAGSQLQLCSVPLQEVSPKLLFDFMSSADFCLGV